MQTVLDSIKHSNESPAKGEDQVPKVTAARISDLHEQACDAGVYIFHAPNSVPRHSTSRVLYSLTRIEQVWSNTLRP